MKRIVFILIGMSAFFLSVQGQDCCVLHQLVPQTHALNSQGAKAELEPLSDDWYELNHTDNWPEYYLGSGTFMDTFFVVFNPIAPCSVKMVEAQWFDSGTIHAFAALYSDSAYGLYPSGQAPQRGTGLADPIGEFIAGPVTSPIEGTQDWEVFSLAEPGFVIGDPLTFEIRPFGIGFEKQGSTPHPMADKMETKGIRYTYTWYTGFG